MTADHWEAYYRGGSLVSCPMNDEPNYSGEVHAVWSQFFATLPDGARLLDIGTGNGAIVLIAKEVAAQLGHRFGIDAVDRAKIDPQRDVPDGARLFESVRFHPGVRAETMPFAAESMGAISGHYAIEYTDTAKTLAEIQRVLKRGGVCQFILHHRDSVVVKNAETSLQQAVLVMQDTEILRKARRYCEGLRDGPAKAEMARLPLMAAGSRLATAAQTSNNALFLNFVMDALEAVLNQREGLTVIQLLDRLAGLEVVLKQWVRRLQDLVSAALTQEQITALAAATAAMGFVEIVVQTQLQGTNDLIGWRLNMTKPS